MGRVRTIFTGVGGTPAYSNFYFDADETSGEDYISEVGDFWNAMKSHIFVGVDIDVQAEVAIIDPVSGAIVGVSNGTAVHIDGTATGDLLPTASSGLLRLRTGVYVGSREIRGRCFVPYPVEADNGAGGGLSTGYATDLASAAGSLLGPSGANGAWVVWSRKNGSWEPVSTTSVWNIWAVMRSRRD